MHRILHTPSALPLPECSTMYAHEALSWVLASLLIGLVIWVCQDMRPFLEVLEDFLLEAINAVMSGRF